MANVLITGGSRGIGRACVRAFCAHGDRVVFLYQKATAEAEALAAETGAYALRADISDPSAAERAVAEALSHLGRIDVLVNNAGVAQSKLFTDLSDADWKRVMGVNLDGAFYVTRSAVRGMIAEHMGGRIINVGSMWGKTGASMEVHYSASKAGLRGLTMALAKELGPSGIRVNSIAPGFICTALTAGFSDEEMRAMAEETPLGRLGQPEDVAEAAAFLASDRASFITGQVLISDGGFLL